MKVLIPLLFIVALSGNIYAQTDTEIYIFDVKKKKSNFFFKNKHNFTKNEGYDSQPYFLGKDALLYAGNRNGQTDIIQKVKNRKRTFNEPTDGGEYSPQPIPGARAVSAVRLDTDGYQRLFRYDPRTRNPEEIVKDAVVAYYTWANDSIIVSADIVEERLHLVIHNSKSNQSNDLGINVGRSFHRIPKSDNISFVQKTDSLWHVKSIHPETLEIQTLATTLPNSEDICWSPDGDLLASNGSGIYYYDSKTSRWRLIHTTEDLEIGKISRITMSPDGSQIAVVAEN